MTGSAAPTEAAEREQVLRLLKRHGWNTTSFQVLEPGFRYFFDGDDACVAYADTGGAWVAAGAPIASDEAMAAVAGRFIAAAAGAGRRARFFAVEARFALGTETPTEAPLRHLLIGEQPVFDPAAWEQTVRTTRSLREQLRRASNKGVSVRVLPASEICGSCEICDSCAASDPAQTRAAVHPAVAASRSVSPTRLAIEALIARWLRSRPMAQMGFLVDVHPFDFPHERRYLIAEADGQLVGFLAAVPIYARAGWFLEDLLREPTAPNGTAELLVDGAMRLFATLGAPRVTLGLAPLSGGVNGWLRAVRDLTFGLYNFHGVRAFKAKFRPQGWEPVYLAYPVFPARGRAGGVLPIAARNGLAALAAIYDSLAAFAGGSLPRFGIQTLLRAAGALALSLAAPRSRPVLASGPPPPSGRRILK